MDLRMRYGVGILATLVACGASRDDDLAEESGFEPGQSGESGVADDGDDGGEQKFDVVGGDGPGGACPDGGGRPGGGEDGETYSYIWIANSLEGTVSKIDTKTGAEEGRYMAAPAYADPSRTSVNLLGDAVAVDRNGGIIKIAVREERCIDHNGTPGIQTSTGPLDVRAWGQDECVVWHTPLPASGNAGPRPVAWEGSDDNGCVLATPRVWVGYYGQGTGEFRRLDGQTGEILDSVSVPWNGGSWGPYGGATNKEGDFWSIGHQNGPLVTIDADTLEYRTWELPEPQGAYGMALDAEGHPWVASLNGVLFHFNPDAEAWSQVQVGPMLRGVMVDKEGIAWGATNSPPGLAAVDTKTETLVAGHIPIVASSQPVGVSIDLEGYVWVVDQGASIAFKIDPDTHALERTVGGLVGPYTYSDMTGGGLDLVTNPPPS